MDEIYFYLSRHLETLQIQLQWGYLQTRQLSLSLGESLISYLNSLQKYNFHDTLKSAYHGFRTTLTVLAQPSDVYYQLNELIRLEMPILYPGGAGFLTGAFFGIIIGLSWQKVPFPAQRMKSIVCMSYDGLDSLSCVEDFIVPNVIPKNHVLIQVKTASVDVVDIRICAGYGRELRRIIGSSSLNMKYGFPVTLGRDCSGIVVEIGRDVRRLDIGDEVWAVSPFWGPGTLSEFVLLPEDWVAKKPGNIGFEGATSLPYAGCLAYWAFLKAGLFQAGSKRVLIQSGVSPVGCIACQLARNLGCEVTVTCSARAAAVARALGASDVVVYGQIDMEDRLVKDRFDVVLNTVGGVSQETCQQLCKPNGVVVSTVPVALNSDYFGFPFSLFYSGLIRVKAAAKRMMGNPYDWTEAKFSGEILDKLADLVMRGQLQPVVDKIYAPQDAILALQHCDSAEAIGKTVINFRFDRRS